MPDDPAWKLVVFVYPDGHSMLDWVHRVSRKFWSEEHQPLERPPHDGELHGEEWFRRMGFDVMVEWESSTRVERENVGPARHLQAVSRNA